jgi:hypothetical protein
MDSHVVRGNLDRVKLSQTHPLERAPTNIDLLSADLGIMLPPPNLTFGPLLRFIPTLKFSSKF